MKKSKRYIYAKKLVYDALRKERYFKKKDKKIFLAFAEYYDWKIYNYQVWKKWGEDRYAKMIATSILRRIFLDSQLGNYYDEEEMADFVDKQICEKILFHMNRILDDPDGKANVLSDGIPAKQRIIDVREAINDLEQIDSSMVYFYENKFNKLIGEE